MTRQELIDFVIRNTRSPDQVVINTYPPYGVGIASGIVTLEINDEFEILVGIRTDLFHLNRILLLNEGYSVAQNPSIVSSTFNLLVDNPWLLVLQGPICSNSINYAAECIESALSKQELLNLVAKMARANPDVFEARLLGPLIDARSLALSAVQEKEQLMKSIRAAKMLR